MVIEEGSRLIPKVKEFPDLERDDLRACLVFAARKHTASTTSPEYARGFGYRFKMKAAAASLPVSHWPMLLRAGQELRTGLGAGGRAGRTHRMKSSPVRAERFILPNMSPVVRFGQRRTDSGIGPVGRRACKPGLDSGLNLLFEIIGQRQEFRFL